MKSKTILEYFISPEENDEVITEPEVEVNTEVPSEVETAPVVDAEEVNVTPDNQKVVNNTYLTMTTDLINSFWQLISQLNSIIATLDISDDCPNKEEVVKIINSVVDDTTISVGVLNGIIPLVNPKTASLLNTDESSTDNIE